MVVEETLEKALKLIFMRISMKEKSNGYPTMKEYQYFGVNLFDLFADLKKSEVSTTCGILLQEATLERAFIYSQSEDADCYARI